MLHIKDYIIQTRIPEYLYQFFTWNLKYCANRLVSVFKQGLEVCSFNVSHYFSIALKAAA